jgi:hypothetical protein
VKFSRDGKAQPLRHKDTKKIEQYISFQISLNSLLVDWLINLDELLKSHLFATFVIPAKAGHLVKLKRYPVN